MEGLLQRRLSELAIDETGDGVYVRDGHSLVIAPVGVWSHIHRTGPNSAQIIVSVGEAILVASDDTARVDN